MDSLISESITVKITKSHVATLFESLGSSGFNRLIKSGSLASICSTTSSGVLSAEPRMMRSSACSRSSVTWGAARSLTAPFRNSNSPSMISAASPSNGQVSTQPLTKTCRVFVMFWKNRLSKTCPFGQKTSTFTGERLFDLPGEGLCWPRGEVRHLQSQLVDAGDEHADIVCDHLAHNLVHLSDLRLGAERISELPLDHAERAFDVRALV